MHILDVSCRSVWRCLYWIIEILDIGYWIYRQSIKAIWYSVKYEEEHSLLRGVVLICRYLAVAPFGPQDRCFIC